MASAPSTTASTSASRGGGSAARSTSTIRTRWRHRKKWETHLGLISAQIKAERFEYRAWFPNGTKLPVFYPGEDQATGKQMTLRAWLEKWHARRSPFRSDNSLMPDADLHPTTWLHNGTVIKAWFRNPKFRMADLQLNDVTTSACLDFKRSLTDSGLSGKTVLNRMGLLHKALQDAVDERLITSNPVPKLASVRRFTKHLRKLSKPLAVEEVQRFLDQLPARVEMSGRAFVSGQTLRDLYQLWFRTGWRSNEVVALRFDWLSASRQVVELRKGRAPRFGGSKPRRRRGSGRSCATTIRRSSRCSNAAAETVSRSACAITSSPILPAARSHRSGWRNGSGIRRSG